MIFEKLGKMDGISMNYLGFGKVAVIASSDVEKIALNMSIFGFYFASHFSQMKLI